MEAASFYMLVMLLSGPATAVQTIPMNDLETCFKQAAMLRRQFSEENKTTRTVLMVRCVETGL